MDRVYELQADTLRTLAHPRRLEILHALAVAPSKLGVSQPNVSQHLALMRASGLVTAERQGREIRYRLADPDVIRACALMRQAMQRRLMNLASDSIGAGRAAMEGALPVRS
jgi:ArsR family transcriptional regulator